MKWKTVSVDPVIYEQFRQVCVRKALKIGRRVEQFMREFVEANEGRKPKRKAG